MPPADGSQAAKIARPAICIHRDAESHVLIIDASRDAGREALERWSYIDPVERAKWAKPYEFRCAEMEAFYAKGGR